MFKSILYLKANIKYIFNFIFLNIKKKPRYGISHDNLTLFCKEDLSRKKRTKNINLVFLNWCLAFIMVEIRMARILLQKKVN